MFALNLDSNSKRILGCCEVLPICSYKNMPIVENLPAGDATEYLDINNNFVYSPKPKQEEESLPTQLDKIEAQVTYTAMMTDTLGGIFYV